MQDLLSVNHLTVTFDTDEGKITPVKDVSFSVQSGRTLGIVGESGSGKSVTTKSIMRLLPSNAKIGPESQIDYQAKNGKPIAITTLKQKSQHLRRLRGGEIGMIFQEPMASFSPVYTIGNQMIEAIRLHREPNKLKARDIAINTLDKVGISNAKGRIDQYPHELSGGMRQRCMIALALAAEPQLLIADEPTTALDVTIQAQVLDLMRQLQTDLQMGMIFITHDLGVIAQIADDVAVMYLGTIVERGSVRDVISNPKHPYTQGLLKAIPSLKTLSGRMHPVPGDIPSPTARPAGCPFHNRCSQALSGLCERKEPIELTIASNHSVRCWLYDEKEAMA